MWKALRLLVRVGKQKSTADDIESQRLCSTLLRLEVEQQPQQQQSPIATIQHKYIQKSIMNGKMDNWSNNREGFMSSLQKMMSKLGDILQQQKTSTKCNNNSPIEMAIDPVELWASTGGSTLNLDSPTSIWDGSDEDSPEVVHLSRLIECTLREAKDGTLSCGEVLLPAELTARVARQAFLLAENEPCGLRGCDLLVNYHQDPSSPTSQPRRIGTVQYDPSTVATFQLVLTLRKDLNTWTNLRHLLPFKACLRKWGKSGTIIVSPTYTLVKKKLYRSRQE